MFNCTTLLSSISEKTSFGTLSIMHGCIIFKLTLVSSIGDEIETIINGVRNEVKSAGLQDTRENCWSFFINRVRKQLKASLVLWSVYSKDM